MKEKGERVLANMGLDAESERIARQTRAEIEEAVAWMLDCQMRALDFYEKNIANKGRGGGASTSGRTGSKETNDEKYHYSLSIPLSDGTILDVPTTICGSVASTFQEANIYISELVKGINSILSADNSYFDKLKGSSVSVLVTHERNIEYKGISGMVGLHTYKEDGSHKIILSGNALMGKYGDYPAYEGSKYVGRKPYEAGRIIAHEFAHAIQASMAGSDYFRLSFRLREYFAIEMSNRVMQSINQNNYRQYNNHRPLSVWLNKILFPNTWGKYAP